MTALAALLAQRTLRERWLLAAMVVAALLWIVHGLVWQPLRARNATLTAEIAQIDQWHERLPLLPASGTAMSPDPRPLPALITVAAQNLGLSIRRLQLQDSGVQAEVGDAPFDSVILWIDALERGSDLRVSDLTLTRSAAPGTVSGSLTVTP